MQGCYLRVIEEMYMKDVEPSKALYKQASNDYAQTVQCGKTADRFQNRRAILHGFTSRRKLFPMASPSCVGQISSLIPPPPRLSK